MKRLILFAAVALAFSTGAIAQNGAAKSTATKLSDAQLDQVTAGLQAVVIGNPSGKAGPNVQTPDRILCINCEFGIRLMAERFGAGGMIMNNGNPDGRYIGNWRHLNP